MFPRHQKNACMKLRHNLNTIENLNLPHFCFYEFIGQLLLVPSPNRKENRIVNPYENVDLIRHSIYCR